MEGSSFTLSGKNLNGIVQYHFDLKDEIRAVEFNLTNSAQLKYFAQDVKLPLSTKELKEWVAALKKSGRLLSLKETPKDLSFIRFWDMYDKKASKKKQAENAWDRMSESDKIQCLLFVPHYRQMKKMDGTELMYANTFLHQELWK